MMKHILVIDDNEDVRKIIGYDLLKAGFAVDDAEDGTSGFALACQRTYDLIIIDWMMPGMNGLALTRALRARNIRSVLFMLTAKDGDNDLEEAFAQAVFAPGAADPHPQASAGQVPQRARGQSDPALSGPYAR